jgi:hypothetical protein
MANDMSSLSTRYDASRSPLAPDLCGNIIEAQTNHPKIGQSAKNCQNSLKMFSQMIQLKFRLIFLLSANQPPQFLAVFDHPKNEKISLNFLAACPLNMLSPCDLGTVL